MAARHTASEGRCTNIGTPPTPMPALGWTGIVGHLHARLDEGDGARHVPGERLAGVDVDHRPEHRGAGLLGQQQLVLGPQAGEALAAPLELAVHAEHELAGHAELHAHVRVLLADDLRGAQRGEELRVAGGAGRVPVDRVRAGLPLRVGQLDHVDDGHLDRLFRGRAGLGDLAQRQQLVPVVARAVRLGVQAQVGHDAVLQRRDGAQLRVVHVLGLVGQDRAHDLERVVADAELQQVGAHPLLVGLQVLDARRVRLHAGAVAAEHDLLADVDADEAQRRRVDLEQVVDLVVGQRRHLGALGRDLRPRHEIGADLAARQMREGAVAHAGRHPGLVRHTLPPLANASRAAGGALINRSISVEST